VRRILANISENVARETSDDLMSQTAVAKVSIGLNSHTFPAPPARLQAGIPFRIGGVVHRVPIEVGRSVRPPQRTARTEFALDAVDRAMRGRFFDGVAGKFGAADRTWR